MECTWCLRRSNMLVEAEFIIAYICDKCSKPKIVDLCHGDFTQWKNQSPQMHCPICGGTLSWEARSLTTGQKEWLVNTIPED